MAPRFIEQDHGEHAAREREGEYDVDRANELRVRRAEEDTDRGGQLEANCDAKGNGKGSACIFGDEKYCVMQCLYLREGKKGLAS